MRGRFGLNSTETLKHWNHLIPPEILLRCQGFQAKAQSGNGPPGCPKTKISKMCTLFLMALINKVSIIQSINLPFQTSLSQVAKLLFSHLVLSLIEPI